MYSLSPDDQIVLPSATRTVTTASGIITNPGYWGCKLFLNVTAASGTGGLYPQLILIDPVSGAINTFTVWGTTAKTSAALYVYNLFPATGLQVYNGADAIDFLPSQFQISIHHGDATNYTYSVGVSFN